MEKQDNSETPASDVHFDSIMSSLPSLGDDADAFAEDIEAVRNSFKEDTDPWEP